MPDFIKYSRVSSNSSQDDETVPERQLQELRPCRTSSLATKLSWLAAVAVASFLLGGVTFLACSSGRTHGPGNDGQALDDWFSPKGSISSVLRYQKPFALRPDNASDAIWASLFPRGGGYIVHPDVSPEPTCVAVYHQLHCLDAIRSGYWAAVDGIEPEYRARPAHIRHCLDYLRQSLMCNMDTNLEPIDPELNGVTGFGSEKKCRDYNRLTAWADEWRARDDM